MLPRPVLSQMHLMYLPAQAPQVYWVYCLLMYRLPLEHYLYHRVQLWALDYQPCHDS
jgi:hypothetical protein